MVRVGLVLGAGGAVGHAFHAATLSALAEVSGWDARTADILVGTSAGSVVAAMLRAGAAPTDLYSRAVGEPMSPAGESLFAGVSWPTLGPKDAVGARRLTPVGNPGTVLFQWLLRPGRVSAGAVAASALPPGRIPNDHVRDGIRHLYRDREGAWPERPVWISAVRVSDGARVVFGRGAADAPAATRPPAAARPPGAADPRAPGPAARRPTGGHAAPAPATDIGTAVAASCAIPGYYRPVRIGGHDHVDGGVHSALNADLLDGQRLDLVLVRSPMTAQVRLPARPDLAVRAALGAQLEREVGLLRRRGTPVVVFEPGPAELEAMGQNPLDPERRAPVARQVLASTRRALEEEGLAAALRPLRAG